MPKLLKATMVDDKRRVTLPASYPPGCAVTIQAIDKDTCLVQRRRKIDVKIARIPIIKHLPDDPEWEEIENRIGRHIARRLPEPKY